MGPSGLQVRKKPRMDTQRGCSGGEGGIRTLGSVATTPDFESGTFDHSATSPGSLSKRRFYQSPQGFLGTTTGALRGAIVIDTVLATNMPPSTISSVAVRSWRVMTTKLFLPRTDETTVQPWAG